MKVIIAGSRTIKDYRLLCNVINESGIDVTQVVSGMAGGVDMLGVRFAKEHNIPLIECPANWSKLGRSAGLQRNVEMSKQAEALIYLHDGISRGTQHMIDTATSAGLKVHGKIIRVRYQNE